MVALVLGLTEGAARLVGPEIPAWRPADEQGVMMTGHPTRLWGLAPGVNGNGRGTATVAPIGLRAPVPVVPRPAGRARIAIVGDSSLFGHGVGDDQTLGAALDREFQARDLDVDIINAGIPGYSTAQSRILLGELVWGLEPTLLLIGSVWSDNNFDHYTDADLLRTAATWRHNPLSHLASMRLLAGWLDRLRGGSGAHLVSWTRSSGRPKGQVRRVSLVDYATNLDLMVREAAERGVGAAFLGLANRDMVMEIHADGGSWDPYFAAQAASAQAHGLPRTTVAPVLTAALAEGLSLDELFVDELHPTGEAFRRIATSLADGLQAASWPMAPLLAQGPSFDTSGLKDPWTTQKEGPGNFDSPQRLLFEDQREAPAEGTSSSREPGPPPVAPWNVGGEVRGPEGPVSIELLSLDGRVLASARLPRPGTFSLRVRGDVAEVKLVATGADGSRVEIEGIGASSGSVGVELR